MTQEQTPLWSGAVQRELDGIQHNVETRFTDFSSRLDKFLTLTEYRADIRALDIQLNNLNEKVEDSELDIENLKRDLRDSLESLRRDILVERQRYEDAISQEASTRQAQHTNYIKVRQEQFRWLMSMVMIPLAIAVVDLVASKK